MFQLFVIRSLKHRATIRKLLELVLQVRVFIFGKWIRLFKRVKETSHIRSLFLIIRVFENMG